MIPNGYILLSRQLAGSEIWQKPPYYLKLWIHLLMKANHAPRRNGQRLDRGQCLITLAELQEAVSYRCGYSLKRPTKQKVWRFLDWTRGARMTTTVKTTRGLVVTICNYNRYQVPQNYERDSERNDSGTALQHDRQELRKKRGSARPAKPPTAYRQMTDLWCELWAAHHDGQKYPFATARDGQAAKRIWEAVGKDLGKAEGVFKAYLADADPFFEGHSLALLSGGGVLPKFLARSQQGQAGVDTVQDQANAETLEQIGKHLGGMPDKKKARDNKEQVA